MKLNSLLIKALTVGIVLGSCSGKTEEFAGTPAAEYRLARLYYENSGGENAFTRFHYDRADQNYMAIWHLDDSSRSSLNYHTLDSAGRLLVKSREYSDGINSTQHYKYNGDGNLVFEYFSRSDGVRGEVDYAYTEDGKLWYADCRGLNGWFHGKIVYTWKYGKKTAADIMKDSVKTGSIIYEYEGEKLILEKWDFPGNWNQVFRYEYQEAAPQTFTSANVFIRENRWFMVASEYYEYNGDSGGPSWYTYDKRGKLTAKEFQRSDGLTTMSTYEYDTAGLLDASLREYGDGRTTDFLYWYSVDRNLLVKTFQWSDGTSGSETYRYKNGILTRGEYVNMDSWLNGTLDFEYDEQNILRIANYVDKDGFDAHVNFSYDLDFNLVKIHWELSSGQNQTYYYKYEPLIL
jgi:hypothetical protein